MLETWLIDHLVCGNYVGLPNGPVFYVITLDQHVLHRRTRVINVKSQLSRSLEPTTYHPQEDRKWIPRNRLAGMNLWSTKGEEFVRQQK